MTLMVPNVPWRKQPWLVELYELIPEDDEFVQSRLGPVIRNELRSEGVQARLREACLRIEDHRDVYGVRAYVLASSILGKIGRKTGRSIAVAGGRKDVKFTVYLDSEHEKEFFAEIAAEQGMSLSAWTLAVIRSAAQSANKGE